MGLMKEFKEFAVKGNVIDMAVGIIIGAAFTKIVGSLVADVIMPPLGMLLSGVNFSDYSIPLKDAVGGKPAVELKYGLFLSAVLDFTIVAFVLFMVIKQINRLKRNDEAPAEPTTKECPRCLTQIPLKATRCAACTSDV